MSWLPPSERLKRHAELRELSAAAVITRATADVKGAAARLKKAVQDGAKDVALQGGILRLENTIMQYTDKDGEFYLDRFANRAASPRDAARLRDLLRKLSLMLRAVESVQAELSAQARVSNLPRDSLWGVEARARVVSEKAWEIAARL